MKDQPLPLNSRVDLWPWVHFSPGFFTSFGRLSRQECLASKVLQEGLCSPARISQTKEVPICTAKCLSQQRFMFLIVSSSSVKGTNSLCPILAYFWAFPDTSEDNRWTVSLFPLSNLCVVFPDHASSSIRSLVIFQLFPRGICHIGISKGMVQSILGLFGSPPPCGSVNGHQQIFFSEQKKNCDCARLGT